MASHYLKQVIDDEKKSEPSIFAFDDPERQKKHPWKAAIEAFGINVFVQSFDRFILNEDFAKISFNSIKHNIKNGFVWDNDQFSTNLFAHPYHGGLYFNAARSNGMNFWESIPYSFCGSPPSFMATKYPRAKVTRLARITGHAAPDMSVPISIATGEATTRPRMAQ